MRHETTARPRPFFWNVATIAKLLWCHQSAIFKMRKETPTIKSAIKEVMKVPNWRVSIPRRTGRPARSVRSADHFDGTLDDEERHARNYPTERRVFKWRNSLILAQPDGLTSRLAYEFKSCAKEFWVKFEKPVARLQVQIYGYLFGRPKVRYDIWLREEQEMISATEKTDRAYVEEQMEKWGRLVAGGMRPWPPKAIKCSSCDFLAECRISPSTP
ncbi:MAG: hypothetical protein HYY17_08885 [Planctomycetes bacterium]|nr:hypothetical protein [Planctomycetota bacterium]